MNVCHSCGELCADKLIYPDGPYAICPACGHKHPFKQLPLLIVGGASWTGKSAVCHTLVGNVQEAVLLDSDILWRDEFDRPDTNHRDYFETWLRACKNIGQSGRPVVLFGAGVGVPHNMETCTERRYFSALHYLALTCVDDILAERLKARPEWRGSSQLVDDQVQFNRWVRDNAGRTRPVVTLLDTSEADVRETSEVVREWISCGLDSGN